MGTADLVDLLGERKHRLVEVMRTMEIPALLTSDPISILYATGARNMTVHGLTGHDRFVLIVADGPTILFEFAGCDHLAVGLPGIDEIRPAPGITANADRVERLSNYPLDPRLTHRPR